MSTFTRPRYLIAAAAIGFVITLNAVPAWAACNVGDQLGRDGQCMRNGRPTGQVICDAGCQAQRAKHDALRTCVEKCMDEPHAYHVGDERKMQFLQPRRYCAGRCGVPPGNPLWRGPRD